MAEVKPDKSDRKRVTLREVAQEAGVSLKTASNVINHSGRMADATREKVQDVIDRLGYRVNVSARNLNRGKTGFITLAVPSLTAPYLAELANRVIDAARIYGYSVYITTYAEGSAQGARALLRNFNATVSDGMILSISEVEDLDPEDLDVDYPLVCVGARSTHGKADHVTPDDVQEARLAAQYLFDHGATNLAVIGSGARMTQRIVDSGIPFDGIVAFNDQLALGALFTLAANGIAVPDRVQVIGFDNNEEAAYFQPPLTTMDSCLDWIAPTAVSRIINRIDGSRTLEPELITTQSRIIARATTRA